MTVAFRIESPDIVAHELAQANRRLARDEGVPDSVREFIRELCEQIAEVPREQWAAVVADQWIAIQQAAMRAQNVVFAEMDEGKQRRNLRMLISELAFRLNRLAEQEQFDAEKPVQDVIRWLEAALPVSQGVKAELLGVHERTYQRWVSESEPSVPTGDDEQVVRLVARVVGDLRHILSPKGVVMWLGKPHPDLGGASPLDVIRASDPEQIPVLFELVASSRAGAAA